MDDLERHVRREVTDWIAKIQEREPGPGEVDQITAAVTELAGEFIVRQVCNALS